MDRITFEVIQKANNAIATIDVKGREYAEVNQRIKAFRMVYPSGFIITDMQSNDNGVCVIKASVGFYDEHGNPYTIGTGTAYEKEGSTFINKTSYIENCETSAVGRALGMAGFGIDTSVASAEEVQNAIVNQEMQGRIKPEYKAVIENTYKGANMVKLLEANHISSIDEMTNAKALEIIQKLRERT